MKVNTDKTTYKSPFRVTVIDAMDAYYYADVMGKVESVTTIETYDSAVKLADEIFIKKNSNWKSLEEMNHCDGGYDVRVYDTNQTCVYAAHQKYEGTGKWITKKREK